MNLQIGSAFWAHLDRLAAAAAPVVERRRGACHPRYPGAVYPLDYGYLEGTRGSDGAAVDVWLGGAGGREVTGVIATVDLDKRDVELKLLLGCSRGEAEAVGAFHNQGSQAAALVLR